MAKKTIKIKIGKIKGNTGHVPHRTGTGPHKDKRLKRQKKFDTNEE